MVEVEFRGVKENVASMTDVHRKRFSDLLGLNPVEVCASCLGDAMRLRLYWPSWDVGDFADVIKTVKPNGVTRLRLCVEGGELL